MVIFPYRPEYYGLTQDDDGNDTRDLAEVIIAKHRNGPTGKIHLKFIPSIIKFADLKDSTQPLKSKMNDF
jgi:replicative DNA helicase